MAPEHEEFKWNLGFDNERPADRITDRKPGRNAARYIDDADETYELPPGFEARDVPRPSRIGRAIGTIVMLGILVGLIFGGVYAANTLSKDAVTGLLAGKLKTAFAVKDDDQLEIDFGSGLFILQAIKGTLEDVTVNVSGGVIGPLTGDFGIEATGVPVDQSDPAKTLSLSVRLNEENLQALAGIVSSSKKSVIGVEDGLLTVSTSVKGPNGSVPVSVNYAPTAEEGKLVLRPQTIFVGKSKKEFTVDEFKKSAYASAGKQLSKKRTVCVAGLLPSSLALTDATASVADFRIVATGTEVRLSGAELTSPGTCA